MILSQRLPALPVIISANVNRAFSKMDHIRTLISAKVPSVFAVTESWFTSDLPDNMISIDGFYVFRDDRNDGRFGGGVAIWVRSCLRAEVYRPVGDQFGCNSAWLFFHRLNICFICIYIPPSSVCHHAMDVVNFIETNLDNVLSKYPSYNIMITGDFNHLRIMNLCSAFDLVNVVTEPTRGSAILDCVLLSASLVCAYKVSVGPPIATSDHRSILCSPKHRLTFCNQRECVVYDLRESFIGAFLLELSKCNFSSVYNMDLNVDDKCHILSDIIEYCFKKTIPCKTVIMTSRDKPFITPLIKSLINERWMAYRQRNFSVYNHLSQKIKSMLFQAKLEWASNASKGSKELWNVVNEIKGTKTTRLSALDSVINNFSSLTEAVEKLNASFVAFQTVRPNPSIPNDYGNDEFTRWAPVVEVNKVYQLISTLKTHKSPGYERIPNVLYKRAAHILAPPLCHIVNVSIISRRFPSVWKTGVVSPVPKSLPATLDQLRPISLLPVLSKICEKAVLETGLSCTLRQSFGQLQFGNVPLSSTTAALICLHDTITRLLDDVAVIGVAVLAYDFSKAFDQIGHDIIVKKLVENRFPLGFILWIVDYLSNRTQMVKIFNTISNQLAVVSGIPQGSILGPFLFNLVISSLQSVNVRTTVIKYVDDCTFVIPMYCTSDPICTEEHSHMTSWSSSVGLRLNHQKCKLLWIPKSRDCAPPDIPNVAIVDAIKILGVYFTPDLKWNKHVQFIDRCASRRLYALRVLRPILDKQSLMRIYHGLILPVLEYCSPLMVGILNSEEAVLERLQGRAHRIVCGEHCLCSKFPNLKDRRNKSSVKFLNKICDTSNHPLHARCPPMLISGRYQIPVSRTTRRRNSFFPCAAILANAIHVD